MVFISHYHHGKDRGELFLKHSVMAGFHHYVAVVRSPAAVPITQPIFRKNYVSTVIMADHDTHATFKNHVAYVNHSACAVAVASFGTFRCAVTAVP